MRGPPVHPAANQATDRGCSGIAEIDDLHGRQHSDVVGQPGPVSDLAPPNKPARRTHGLSLASVAWTS